ncbi:cytochrome ubiquinol oxidase subunit I, partial [Pseudomonas sp. BJa3]|nr:cytochrome ubiquinol oxidase subunit I [Pseudomonas sp. BJa3]
NFAIIPEVQTDDAYWNMKKNGYKRPINGFSRIHMPSNTAAGIIAGFFSLVVSFALVWHIWWLVALGLIGFIATIVCHSLTGDHHG